MHDPADRIARIKDAHYLLHLVQKFPCLPYPSMNEFLASFRYTGTADAGQAAESVRVAEGILSRQLGVAFRGAYPAPVGSSAHYQLMARLESGMHVYIVARAEVGPLLEACERELEDVAA